MADIKLEKKSQTPWGWLLAIAAAAALLIIIGLVATGGEEPTAVTDMGQPGAQTERDGFPAEAILANPADWEGESVEGQVRVASVPTDRGFWIEKDGSSMFVLINPEGGAGAESDINIREDQRLLIRNARVLSNGQAAEVSGGLDEESRRIIAELPAFLTVDEEDVEIIGEG